MKASNEGYKWVAAQAEDTPANMFADLRVECHSRGILCGVWQSEVDYGSPGRVADGWDFYIGQVEGPNQYDRLVSSLADFRSRFPSMPAAVVTQFGGLETAEKARPFIEANFTCIVEAHIREDGVTPERRLDYATRVCRFPRVQAMCGLGNGATMADYPNFNSYVGGSVFAAEYLP